MHELSKSLKGLDGSIENVNNNAATKKHKNRVKLLYQKGTGGVGVDDT